MQRQSHPPGKWRLISCLLFVCALVVFCVPAPSGSPLEKQSVLETEGVLFAVSFRTPILSVYASRWKGRGPYLQELQSALATLKNNTARTRVSLVTDDVLPPNVSSLFDQVVIHDSSPFKAEWSWRVSALLHSPYDRTIHLDTDVRVCESLSPLFAFGKEFDFAASVDPPIESRVWMHLESPEAARMEFHTPHRLAGYNPGTLVYRKRPATTLFIKKWVALIEETNWDDMRALREYGGFSRLH